MVTDNEIESPDDVECVSNRCPETWPWKPCKELVEVVEVWLLPCRGSCYIADCVGVGAQTGNADHEWALDSGG